MEKWEQVENISKNFSKNNIPDFCINPKNITVYQNRNGDTQMKGNEQNYNTTKKPENSRTKDSTLRKCTLLQIGKLLLEKELITDYEYRRYIEIVKR